MAVFAVDSDAVIAQSAAVRGTIERLQAESTAMMAQLTNLQSTWTGSAAVAFHGATEQWRVTQRHVEEALAGISAALGAAGRQYAETEMATAGLFR